MEKLILAGTMAFLIIGNIVAKHFNFLAIYLLCIFTIGILHWIYGKCVKNSFDKRKNTNNPVGINQKIFGSQTMVSTLYMLALAIMVFDMVQISFIFFIPLIVSTVGKIYEIFMQQTDFNRSIMENMIIFQGKLQFFMLIYITLVGILNLLLLKISLKKFIVFLIVLILFRVKYTYQYGFRRSVTQLHLAFDGFSRKMGFRQGYHSLYKWMLKILFINQMYKSSKTVSY